MGLPRGFSIVSAFSILRAKILESGRAGRARPPEPVTSVSSCGERIKAKGSREAQAKYQKPVPFNPIFTLIKARGSVSGLTPGNLNPACPWAPRCAQRPPRHGLRRGSAVCRGSPAANGTIYRSQLAAAARGTAGGDRHRRGRLAHAEKNISRELGGCVFTPG